MKKMIKKIISKVFEVTTFTAINDLIFTGVVYATTGSIINTFTTFSSMKVASTIAYLLYSEKVNWSPKKKALGWEIIISIIGLVINSITTGNMISSVKITLLMKISFLINVKWFEYMERRKK